MVCRQCGVETGSGSGHSSETECIKALTAEIERARRLLRPPMAAPARAESPAVGRRPEHEEELAQQA